jgi:hypothetical protein
MNYDGINVLDSYKERFKSPMSDPEPGVGSLDHFHDLNNIDARI